MSTYTKEQLIARINQVTAINKYRISRDTDAEGLVMDNELLAIALASLYAEPVHQFIYNNPYEEGYTEWMDCNKDYFNGVPEDCRRILYTAPPEPVSMKDHQIRELVNELRDIAIEYHGTQQLRERIARTIRAAMLQGANGNSPVIPDGWVACSERLPPEGYEPDGGAVCYLVWHKNDVDCGPQYSISNVFFLRKHWEKNFTHWMPLPAAPQQDVRKNNVIGTYQGYDGKPSSIFNLSGLEKE